MAEEIADGKGQEPAPSTNAPGGQAVPEVPVTEDEQKTYPADYVKKLRDEAAAHRVENARLKADQAKREADALAAQGKYKELYEKSETARLAAEHANLVARVGARHGLPEEIAELLKGATEEELEAHALKLAALLPKPAAQTPPPPESGNPTNPARSASAPTKQKIDPKHPPRLGDAGVFSAPKTK